MVSSCSFGAIPSTENTSGCLNGSNIKNHNLNRLPPSTVIWLWFQCHVKIVFAWQLALITGIAARKRCRPKMTEQEEELQEFTPRGFNPFVTSGKQFKYHKRNTKKSEFSVVLCLVACHTKINKRDKPSGSCAFSLSHKFSSTFTDMQQMRKSGHVCIHLELCLGLSVSPDAFFCPANTVELAEQI